MSVGMRICLWTMTGSALGAYFLHGTAHTACLVVWLVALSVVVSLLLDRWWKHRNPDFPSWVPSLDDRARLAAEESWIYVEQRGRLDSHEFGSAILHNATSPDEVNRMGDKVLASIRARVQSGGLQ